MYIVSFYFNAYQSCHKIDLGHCYLIFINTHSKSPVSHCFSQLGRYKCMRRFFAKTDKILTNTTK